MDLITNPTTPSAIASQHTPKHLGSKNIDPIQSTLESIQQKVVTALEVFLPIGFDFSGLETVFMHQVSSINDYAVLIRNLVEYFIKTISENMVRLVDYTILEQQTQKLEAEIRNHIKIQQSVKLFMDEKLKKLDKYKNQTLQLTTQLDRLMQKYRQQQLYIRTLTQHSKISNPIRPINEEEEESTLLAQKRGIINQNAGEQHQYNNYNSTRPDLRQGTGVAEWEEAKIQNTGSYNSIQIPQASGTNNQPSRRFQHKHTYS